VLLTFSFDSGIIYINDIIGYLFVFLNFNNIQYVKISAKK